MGDANYSKLAERQRISIIILVCCIMRKDSRKVYECKQYIYLVTHDESPSFLLECVDRSRDNFTFIISLERESGECNVYRMFGIEGMFCPYC